MAEGRYLNHAGTSWPKPAAVRRAAADALAAPPASWGPRFEAAHGSVAAAFGVAPDTLLVTPSCTQALAVAVADVPWQPGDRVLTSGMEHHALMRPLHLLAARGVERVVAPRAPDGPLDLDAVEATLRAGGVKLVAVSMASNVTGECLPWAELVALAHAHGALCLLDGAQVAGWQPLDLAALGVDLFAFAGHKGPQGPPGVGGLYVRPGVPLATPPAACDGEACRPGPGYCDTGSVSLPGLCGLAEGLRWMAEHAPLADARTVEQHFRDRARALPGVRVLGSDGPRMPTCSLVVDGHRPLELAARLAERGTVVRGGTQCAPAAHDTLGTGADGTLRVSFGPRHTLAAADHAVEALREVLTA